MSPLLVAQRLRARSGKGSTDAPNVCLLAGVPHRPPLYLLVEQQSGDDVIITQMLAAATESYRKSRGSLTGGLLNAIRAAQTTLHLTKSFETPQIGLNAILLNKNEAILAQVEPAVCWRLREGTLTRWPEDSPWLDIDRYDVAIRREGGGLAQSEPQLTRISLRAGDRLMLATTSVARDVGELLIAEALAQSDPATALQDLVPDLGYTAISIDPNPARGTAKTSVNQVVLKTPRRPVRALESRAADLSSSARPRPVVRRPAPAPEPSEAAEEFEDDEVVEGRTFHLPSLNLRPYLAVVGVSILFVLKFFWTIVSLLLRLFARALPDRETTPALRTFQARRQVMESNPLENRVLVGLALAIPVLVLLSVAILRNQTTTVQANQFVDVLAQASETYQTALTLQNQDSKKAQLLKANQLVDQALVLSPHDTNAKELQTKISNELDKLGNVTKFFFYPVLYTFDEKDSRPAAVIARGIDIYVLDNGLNRLDKFLLNDTKDGLLPTPTRSATSAPTPNPVVMRQGDERGSIVIGRLADIFWASPGGGRTGAGVLTLTGSKQVVEYLPAKGINVLGLGAATGWKEATLGESFNGNLYLLDANGNRIVKYTPTGEDYKSTPADYVMPGQKVDFAGATDMAVDGFVWVLLADGTILKFDTGNLLPFEKKGLEVPLRKPVAMVAQQNSQYIWVADAGNRRIVQLTKNGDFVRQLKPDDPNVMSDLRGMAVDEANKRFYFVNGNKLFMGTLQN